MGLDFFGSHNEKAREFIQAAALEYHGEIFLGQNHGQAFSKLEETHPDFEERDVHDGFLTTANRFVDRVEAAEIAEQGHQVNGSANGRLDSDDITEFRQSTQH